MYATDKQENQRNYLFVVAHPDDELIGAGASIKHLADEGHKVFVCILTGKSPTREDGLPEVAEKTHKYLGIENSIIGDFGCMKLKDADHYSVVRFIETAIRFCEPDVVITHHPADLHNDHYITSICCQEAVRLPQRQIGYDKKIKQFMFMEVKSSSDWYLNHSLEGFKPTFYLDVTEDDVMAKIFSISMYDNVVRPVPHSRSSEAIKALACYRGSEIGFHYAEAFQIVFSIGD